MLTCLALPRDAGHAMLGARLDRSGCRYSRACHEATMQLGDLIRQLLVEQPKAKPAEAGSPSIFNLYRKMTG